MRIHAINPRSALVAITASLVVAMAGTAPAGDAEGGSGFSIDWYTVDGGGGTSTGGGWTLSATIGQPDAGNAAGGTFDLAGGFWAGGGGGAPPCPQDADGSGEVDFGDILTVIANFGGPGFVPADIDNDGDIDFDDLLTVLANFGPCP